VTGAPAACDRCLARAWLLARVASHLDPVRNRIEELLALGDERLLDAVGGERRQAIARELLRLDVDGARERAAAAGIELVCRCDPGYPVRLLTLESPPAVLHVAGSMRGFLDAVAEDPVAIVGARRASSYGLEVARALGAGLGASGVTVVSGMALGVDSAAHAGALAAGAATVTVLPGSAERPYPTGKRALHRQIRETGAAISELPPGTGVWRWMFPARNRIIAAITATTVVVEAGERSGALVTARIARRIGRPVGAVPGRITSALAAGPNGLLASGGYVVRGPQDVLDQVFGAGVRTARLDDRSPLEPDLRDLLALIADGTDTAAALSRAGMGAEEGLAALASLELAGYVRRGPGGRFSVVP
jgi:DNA processing protein